MWILLVVLGAITSQGFALRCYACDSGTNPACFDPFSSSSGVGDLQCGLSNSHNPNSGWNALFPGIQQSLNRQLAFTNACIKAVSTTANGREMVFRGCSITDNMCSALKYSMEQQGGKVHFCDTCQGELCNAAPGSARAAILVLILSVMLSAVASIL